MFRAQDRDLSNLHPDTPHLRSAWPCVCALLFVLLCGSASIQAEPAPPNIVYILADDQGWGDAGCNNPDAGFPTPGIDRIAAEGIRFTDAHSASGVCTPTRYGLLTGRYPWRTHLRSGVLQTGTDPLIDASTLTVGGLLSEHGYDTACIGKWHLGFRYQLPEGESITQQEQYANLPAAPVGSIVLGGPTTRGFDTFLGFHHAREMPTWIEGDRVTENMHPMQTLPRITDEAVEYIKDRGASDDGPFFLYLPLSSPHTPILPTEDWQGKSGLNSYADFVMQTDDTVVRVLNALDEAGLAENTIVLFTADNGCSPQAKIEQLRNQGHDPMAGFRGHKADAWEGGHRVPFVVRWPGVIEAGRVSHEPICLNSLLATCAELLGQELPEDAGVDSFSILPVLRGEAIDQPTHPIIIHASIKGELAIREGDWKYLACEGSGGWSKGGDGKPAQLYNLAEDPGETNNLIEAQPERAEAMRQLLLDAIDKGRTTPGPVQANDVEVKL